MRAALSTSDATRSAAFAFSAQVAASRPRSATSRPRRANPSAIRLRSASTASATESTIIAAVSVLCARTGLRGSAEQHDVRERVGDDLQILAREVASPTALRQLARRVRRSRVLQLARRFGLDQEE